MAQLPKEWHCPKCGRRLKVSGEVEFEGEVCPVFQCDDCEIDGGMFGQVAFTFVIDGAGHWHDPAADVEGL